MAEESSSRAVKILVVDDDPDIVKVIRIILKMEGYQVLEATSGMQGYMMTKNEMPDVVLLDIMMPDIDGFEVCRKLKLDPDTKDIPIIFVTAKTGREHFERGLSLGAQGYITKPFLPDAILKKIKEVICTGD